MTDDQLFAILNCELDENGYPKLHPPSPKANSKSERDHFDYHCFLIGITDKDAVERLWVEKQAKANG